MTARRRNQRRPILVEDDILQAEAVDHKVVLLIDAQPVANCWPTAPGRGPFFMIVIGHWGYSNEKPITIMKNWRARARTRADFVWGRVPVHDRLGMGTRMSR